MALRDLDLKNEYRSFADDIVQTFYIPVLKNTILYQRAVGFFSSSALSALAPGISELVKKGGKIQIVASPKLSEEDINDIKSGYDMRKTIENALLRGLTDLPDSDAKENLSYISKLIAKNVMDIKIAFLSKCDYRSMYHEKVGIMTDENGDSIAFSGSMNESENAFYNNYESFDVFQSWTSDAERVFQKKSSFKAVWEDYEPGVTTLSFPEAVKKKLLSYTPEKGFSNALDTSDLRDDPKEDKQIYLPLDLKLRQYQIDAISSWKAHQYTGIYDMATGTGKTLTALASVEQLYRDNNDRLAVVIICPYQHLVEQWTEDIVTFGMNPIIGYSSSKQKDWKKRLEQAVRSFNLKVTNHFCFVTTNASFATKYVQSQIQLLSDDTVFVVDEAHNMGSVNYQKFLPKSINYRLALSATIDRHNDESGTESLKEYFGEKCIVYSLKDAIDNDMLTRYYYHPVLTFLTDSELDEYLELTKQIVKGVSNKKGKLVLTELAKQLLIKRSRIVAGASNKIAKLKETILPFKSDKHILVYCGATTLKEDDSEGIEFGKRQIDVVSKMLGDDLGMRIGRFTSAETAQEREQIRSAFADGEMLQALVAIKCLDEGVNIPSIKSAFILASSTNPKEYIQRRGRVLRKFPGKRYAVIYDFITLPFAYESLSTQSEAVINSTRGLIKRELIRMLDFSEISENPSETNKLIFELKHQFNIKEEELTGGDDENVI